MGKLVGSSLLSFCLLADLTFFSSFIGAIELDRSIFKSARSCLSCRYAVGSHQNQGNGTYRNFHDDLQTGQPAVQCDGVCWYRVCKSAELSDEKQKMFAVSRLTFRRAVNQRFWLGRIHRCD